MYYNEKDIKLFKKYCKNHKYYPLILPARKENEIIIAIGDLHGDFNLTLKVLRIAKVIDYNNNWIGGNTIVVQVGDQVDGCRPLLKGCQDEESNNNSMDSNSSSDDLKGDIEILHFMTELNEKANRYGGAVISLLGNHELMNVSGNMTYVSKKDIDKFKNYRDLNGKLFKNSIDARKYAFKPGNEFAKLLACTRLPAVIIGSYIFVHAGFISKFLNEVGISNRDDLYKISYLMRQWLLGLIDKNNVINIINSKAYSMFWDRILGAIPPNMNNDDPRCIEYLDSVLKLFDVGTMVIGHTPQSFNNNQGINKTCGNKLWRIDFGGSSGFDKFDEELKNNHKISNLRGAQVLKIRGDSNEPEIIK